MPLLHPQDHSDHLTHTTPITPSKWITDHLNTLKTG